MINIYLILRVMFLFTKTKPKNLCVNKARRYIQYLLLFYIYIQQKDKSLFFSYYNLRPL